MDTFERRWRLLELLCEGPMTRATILERLERLAPLDGEEGDTLPGLAPANLSDDVKLLRRLGIGFKPLPAGAKAKRTYALSPALLTLFADRDEARALFLAGRILKDLQLPESEHLDRLFRRIPGPVREGVDETAGEALLAPGPAGFNLSTVRLLQEALDTGKPLTISYRSVNGKARRYCVEAGYLRWMDGALYLVGHCPDEPGDTRYHRNREFRLDRFTELKPHPVVEVHATGIAKQSTVPSFELRFRAVRGFGERFEATPLPDGHHAPVAGTVKVAPPEADGSRLVRIVETIPLRAVRRILSYGDRVQLEGPDFIRTELVQTLERMLGGLQHAPAAP